MRAWRSRPGQLRVLAEVKVTRAPQLVVDQALESDPDAVGGGDNPRRFASVTRIAVIWRSLASPSSARVWA